MHKYGVRGTNSRNIQSPHALTSFSIHLFLVNLTQHGTLHPHTFKKKLSPTTNSNRRQLTHHTTRPRHPHRDPLTEALNIHASCGTKASDARICFLPSMKVMPPAMACTRLLLPDPVGPTTATAEGGDGVANSHCRYTRVGLPIKPSNQYPHNNAVFAVFYGRRSKTAAAA